MNATVVATWIERGHACMAVRVAADTTVNGQPAAVEYNGRVPMDDAWTAMTGAEKKTALVAACKAVRDAQVTAPPTAPNITGVVIV